MGNSKGHMQGGIVIGKHTTLIDSADSVLKIMHGFPWLESIRLGKITAGASGGRPSVTIKLYADRTRAETLKMIFRQSNSVQDIFICIKNPESNLSAIIADIRKLIGKELRGYAFYDRTTAKISDTSHQENTSAGGKELLERWKQRGK